jgi:hypothetical protein
MLVEAGDPAIGWRDRAGFARGRDPAIGWRDRARLRARPY